MHDTPRRVSFRKPTDSLLAYLLWIWDVPGVRQHKSAELVKILDSPSPPKWRTEILGLERVRRGRGDVAHLEAVLTPR